jgi:hypothetical protein
MAGSNHFRDLPSRHPLLRQLGDGLASIRDTQAYIAAQPILNPFLGRDTESRRNAKALPQANLTDHRGSTTTFSRATTTYYH